MSGDEIVKALFGLILLLLGGTVSWLAKSILTGQEAASTLGVRVGRIESDLTGLRDNQLNVDMVRKVIEEALEKRDKLYEIRRAEWEKIRGLEIRDAIHTEMERLVPRIINEIRGASGTRGTGGQTK